MNQRPTGELATKVFNGAKVFSATMAQDREFLGDKVTAWIQSNPRRQIVDTVVTLSTPHQGAPLATAGSKLRASGIGRALTDAVDREAE